MATTPSVDPVLRAISHDFKEPLRSIRYYADEFVDFKDIQKNKPAMLAAQSFLTAVARAQDEFSSYYDMYKVDRSADGYRAYAEQELGSNIAEVDATWREISPFTESIKFPIPGVSIDALNKTINRLSIRYEGLLTYLRLGQQLHHQEIGLHLEFDKVLTDLVGSRIDAHVETANIQTIGAVVDQFDQLMISLMFQNLLANSFKFRQRDSILDIILGFWQVRASHLSNWVDTRTQKTLRSRFGDNPFYLLGYADNGTGLDKSYHESVFDPYSQGPGGAEKGGAGMGLSIVRTVVNRHEGHVWLQSKPDYGIQFFIALPIVNRIRFQGGTSRQLRELLEGDPFG